MATKAKPAAKKAAPAKAVKKTAPAAKKTSAPKTASKAARLNPYLSFNGNCEAAFKFYKKAFGGEFCEVYRYKDMPPSEGKVDAKHRNRILHMGLPVGGMLLMGHDSCPDQPAKVGNNITLSICAGDAAEAKRVFKALSSGGKVVMPLAKTYWAELYGVVIDRFDIPWAINLDAGM